MQQPRSEAHHETPRPSGTATTGIPKLFEEAYLQFAPRLRKIAIAKFGIARADAESLVHDVFTTFFAHASEVNAVEPYLIGAICNASRQHLRRLHAAGEIFFCHERPCAAAPGPDVLRQVERRLLLGSMLARVGCRCRELFDRYYVNGESSQTIAAALETTPGSVLVFLHRCRKRALAAYRSMAETS
jgi:DNA-directed RNA polymerase specialized sigma24 family protein